MDIILFKIILYKIRMSFLKTRTISLQQLYFLSILGIDYSPGKLFIIVLTIFIL